MSLPRISVVMPIYNGEVWLTETLESLRVQTERNFEIVAVDDGSSDGSREVIEAFARRDARVRLIARPHRGIVAALNTGLEAARAPYIARMDCDDICHPQRLQRQADYLDTHPEVDLVSCLTHYGGDRETHGGFAAFVSWTNSLLTPQAIALNRFVESPLIHPTVAFRARLIDAHGAYRHGSFPEDYELWLRWLDAGVTMARIPETLLTWRERPNRLSRVDERYATQAFYQIKTFYLVRALRASAIPEKLVIWGAGRPTRRRAELLVEAGCRITAYVDVNPSKIGNRIQGRPVWSPEQLPPPGTHFVLSYVANRGARAEIGAYLEKVGYRAGQDYLLAG